MDQEDDVSEWVSIADARELPGLRLVLLRGLPSPWSVAARAIFELKRVPFVKVQRSEQDIPDALREWTGQDSFPAAMYEDERPRSGWAEILLLAERLGARPRLIPDDPYDRAFMFGLAHEICGEMGLAWSRRLMGLAARLRTDASDPGDLEFARKYGSSPGEMKSATGRVVDVLRLLAVQLRRQHDAGREFLVGETLSAADIYWATFCNLISPLPDDQLPLAAEVRKGFTADDPQVRLALDPLLIEHRDTIYQEYLQLPVEL
ncbi:MAG: hypothetical protein V3V67_14550 [Myxococcota bacterium]